jgi:hypothetical protein
VLESKSQKFRLWSIAIFQEVIKQEIESKTIVRMSWGSFKAQLGNGGGMDQSLITLIY